MKAASLSSARSAKSSESFIYPTKTPDLTSYSTERPFDLATLMADIEMLLSAATLAKQPSFLDSREQERGSQITQQFRTSARRLSSLANIIRSAISLP